MAEDFLFFKTPDEFRHWLQENHATSTEQWVGFYKKATEIPSITWPESVDQALCFGWIDGLRKSIDPKSYKIRFTPRKPNSHWSTVNISRIAELKRSRDEVNEEFKKIREENKDTFDKVEKVAKDTFKEVKTTFTDFFGKITENKKEEK